MSLLKRIFAENRVIVLSLAAAIVVNIGVYALVVRPLQAKSAGAADRADASRAALRAAASDLAAAKALVTGKSRAEQELSTFYDRVIPGDFPAARRMTYSALPALARKTGVKWDQRHTTIDTTIKNGRLGHVLIKMVLEGDYENLRRFIYELETAPEFVVIDDVTLTQSEAGKPLVLTLSLSTYYRLGANGS